MEFRELEGNLKKGFKIDYSKIKRAVHTCELDKKSIECKKLLKELGIEEIN